MKLALPNPAVVRGRRQRGGILARVSGIMTVLFGTRPPILGLDKEVQPWLR